ncbi:unnamed protein product [Rangifer tarandus platyrhynchus]|uniref:Uncharacterized protein n=1 Tax=Rangifer tarandus platyrhynchus TaxID=3082113 RepID=A0ACB1MK00_RANTA
MRGSRGQHGQPRSRSLCLSGADRPTPRARAASISRAGWRGGHSVCADTEWKWEFGHNRRPLGEFCSLARIQGSWTGLSALGSSTGPANRSKLGRSPGSAWDAGRLGMDFTG